MNKSLSLSLAIFTSSLLSGCLSPVTFTDISNESEIGQRGMNSAGPAFADYDNDGDVDIYVTSEALADGIENRLWENDGSGNFKNVAKERGVENTGGYGRGSSWGDFDNDGDLDLLISNMPPGGMDRRRKHIPTSLYKNLLIETGTANFENITRAANIMREGNEEDQKIGGIGNTAGGIGWADYNNDGLLDFYWRCAEYDCDNGLFKNNGDGTFTDVTKASGTGIVGKVLKANSQGSPTWTDLNQDGWVDLIVEIGRAHV